jgi:hypothetical protein
METCRICIKESRYCQNKSKGSGLEGRWSHSGLSGNVFRDEKISIEGCAVRRLVESSAMLDDLSDNERAMVIPLLRDALSRVAMKPPIVIDKAS